MAHQSTMTSAATHGFTDKIAALWTDYRANAERRKLYRETLTELRALSTRDLDDLGLNRTMLKRIAYQAAYEK